MKDMQNFMSKFSNNTGSNSAIAGSLSLTLDLQKKAEFSL